MTEPAIARPGPRRALATFATVAIVAALLAYLWDQRSYIAESFALDPLACAGVAALTVLTLALRGRANQHFYGGLGVRAPFLDWFGVVTVTAFTNYLPLSAGLVAKAFYLKQVHALSYGRFAGAQLGLLLLILGTNGAVGLVALAVAHPEGLTGPVGAGFGLLLVSPALLFVPRSMGRRLGSRWLAWEDHATPEARRSWPAVVLLQAATQLATATTLWLCFGMGRVDASFAACAVFGAAIVITRVVTLTPGALGVREFLIGGLAYLTGFELRDAVIASTLARAVEIAVVFILGALFTWVLSQRVAGSYD